MGAGFAQQEGERHTVPLAAARHAMRELDTRRLGRTPLGPRVARTLDEEDARGRGQAPDLVDREDQRTIDHPVDQEPVLVGIDFGNAAAADLEVERRRRDGPQRFVQGREIRSPFIWHRRGPLLPHRVLETGAVAVWPHGPADDPRRIVGCRLTRGRSGGAGRQRRPERDAGLQESPPGHVW